MGSTDVQLIAEVPPSEYNWNMAGGKTKAPSKDAVAAEEPAVSEQATEQIEPKESLRQGVQKNLQRMKMAPCCQLCFKIWYVLLSVNAIILSMAMFVVTVVAAITTKAYDTEQSSRLGAMVLLSFTAAVTLSAVIFGLVGMFKNKVKNLSMVAIILVILALLQAIIAGVSVNVSPKDEVNLGKALAVSFKFAKDGNSRHVKIWDATQNDLNCCGVYGPDDYRSQSVPYYFAPNVPISCCPNYDPDRPDLVQEREREVCRAKKTYYDVGCKNLVVEVFKETSKMILGVTVGLIIIEIILATVAAILIKKAKRQHATEETKLEN